MKNRLSYPYFFIFLFIISALLGVIQFGIVTLTLSKLGLSVTFAFYLLVGSLVGSVVNIPLFTIESDTGIEYIRPSYSGLLKQFEQEFTGKTVIAINIGGAVIPILFSTFLVFYSTLKFYEILLGTGLVSIISYFVSRPIMGLGIGMPILIAPVTAALVALMINIEQSAPLAYISGTMGVLIGADLLRLKDVQKFRTPVASIGGAGTFDGIFITGVIAVLLT